MTRAEHPERERGPEGWRPAAATHRPGFVSLIADPKAGAGRVAKAIPVIQRELPGHGFGYHLAVATKPGEAAELTREALARGERFVVAVGDDATVSDVLNGFLVDDRPVDPEAVLGVLSANSGGDVVRSFGLSQDPAEAVARFEVGDVYSIDVGKATVTASGGARSRYFLNMAQVGLGGATTAMASRLPRVMGRARLFAGYWLAMAACRRPRVLLKGDRREFEGRVTNVLVANLQFGRNGMWLAPRAWPEDGYLDLQVFTGPRSESFTLLPKMFQGEHLPHPHVLELRSTKVGVESDRPLWVEADGVPLGRTPATFEVLPRILRFKV